MVEVRFAGNDMRPHKVRAKEIAEVITSYEDAVASVVVQDNPELDKDTILISLVAIESSSIGLQFAPNLQELTFDAASRIATSIASNDFSELPHSSVESLRTIWSFTKRHECEAEFRTINGESKVVATLYPTTEIPTPSILTGETVLYGEIKRVGGAKPKIMLATIEGVTVYCDVSEAIAKELGHRLYTEVGLKGRATWNSKTLELESFVVEEVLEYTSNSPVDAFRELRDLIGESFTDIDDVNKFVSSLR